jgi:hypothetical protein
VIDVLRKFVADGLADLHVGLTDEVVRSREAADWPRTVSITARPRGVGGSVGVTAMSCLGNRCSGNSSMDFDTSAASNVTLYANY